MLRRISTFAAGRRSKWPIVAGWALLGVALAVLQPRLGEATTNANLAFLPETAGSALVDALVEERFADGREVATIVVYERPGGLTGADRARIVADGRALCATPRLAGRLAVIDPFSGGACGRLPGYRIRAGPSPLSADGTVALTLVRSGAEGADATRENTEAIREIVPGAEGDGGLRAYVSGAGGIVADADEASDSGGTVLLAVCAAVLLVMLAAATRSPVLALVGLAVVAVAYSVAAGIAYGLVEVGGLELSGQAPALLTVLVFGAGGGYCLLGVDRSTAAILVAATGALALADFEATRAMGVVLAFGAATVLLAVLTLLPALLAVLGRDGVRLGGERRLAAGLWRRAGDLVAAWPLPTVVLCTAMLGAGALTLLGDRGSLDLGEGIRGDHDSQRGRELIEERLIAGQTASTTVLTARESGTAVSAALRAAPGVEAVAYAGRSSDERLTRFEVTLAAGPFSEEATGAVSELRERAETGAGGKPALVGGLSAESHDAARTLRDDARLIVPLVLLLTLLILCALLQALVAPLYLVGVAALCTAFALGAGGLVFDVLGQPDSDPGLSTLAFVFAIGVGAGWDAFLFGRIREEGGEDGAEAVALGLAECGGLIAAAGLIGAGAFLALLAQPLESLSQLGFTVALALLVQTFVGRALLVPSIAFILGPRS